MHFVCLGCHNRMMAVGSLCGMCQRLLNIVCISSLTVDKLEEIFHPVGSISGSRRSWNELQSVKQGCSACFMYPRISGMMKVALLLHSFGVLRHL